MCDLKKKLILKKLYNLLEYHPRLSKPYDLRKNPQRRHSDNHHYIRYWQHFAQTGKTMRKIFTILLDSIITSHVKNADKMVEKLRGMPDKYIASFDVKYFTPKFLLNIKKNNRSQSKLKLFSLIAKIMPPHLQPKLFHL